MAKTAKKSKKQEKDKPSEEPTSLAQLHVDFEGIADEDAGEWDKLLQEVEMGDGDIVFLKDGRTQIILTLDDPNNIRSFYAQYASQFQGRTRTRYILRAFLPELEKPGIRYVPVGVKIFKEILQYLGERYPLLTGDKRHGLIIRKSGSGLQTEYTTRATRDLVEVPEMEEPNITLAQAVVRAMEISARSSANSKNSSDETKGKKKKDKDEDDLPF